MPDAYLRKLQIHFTRGEFKNPLRGQVRDPEALCDVFRDLKDEAKETLLAVYLSHDLEVNSYEVLTIGTASMTLISPDDVFRGAILTNSPYFVLLHNHPSGTAAPSEEDRAMIAILHEQSAIMRRHFLDFLIVAEDGHWSMFDEVQGGEYSLGAAA